jgi:DNA mismatch repair ATPase MutS
VKNFNEKTKEYSNKTKRNLNDLFKPGVVHSFQNFIANNDFANIVSGLNPSNLNNFESLKNLQLSFNNINYNTFNLSSFQEPKELPTKLDALPVKEIFLKPSKQEKDFLNKQRRRSIKNNKIVFVHSQKNKVIEKIESEEAEDEELEESMEEVQKDVKYVPLTDEYGLLPNGKKPRGSRYRGVSRNGNQWQVRVFVYT